MNQMLQGQPAAPLSGADPSMEDILASIRRILNDDDSEVAAAAAAEVEPLAAEPPDNVFLLDPSMIVEEPAPAVETAMHEAAVVAEIREVSAMESGHGFEAVAEDDLVDREVATATSSVMGELAKAVAQRDVLLHRAGGVSLEDLVRDELRPQLKTWLDVNLQPIVERLVRTEIERVSRSG